MTVFCELFVEGFSFQFVCDGCALSKAMVVLLGRFCFLLVRPAMVFQSLWVLYLWSHPSVMCSFHISSLFFFLYRGVNLSV